MKGVLQAKYTKIIFFGIILATGAIGESQILIYV